jgi:hypothetical protein
MLVVILTSFDERDERLIVDYSYAKKEMDLMLAFVAQIEQRVQI